MAMQAVEHTTVVPPFFGAGVEFAVGKGSRTALAKGVVGVGVQYPSPVQGRHIPAALPDGFSPLDHQRFESQLQQPQGGKQARRSGAHDDNRRCRADIPVAKFRQFRCQGFVVGIDPDAQVDPDLSLAGVDGATADNHPVGRD